MEENNTTDLQREYAELTAQEKRCKARKEVLKVQLQEAMGQESSVETEVGTFKMTPHTKWEYTAGLTERMEDIKIDQVNEQEGGEACPTITYSLRFNAVK